MKTIPTTLGLLLLAAGLTGPVTAADSKTASAEAESFQKIRDEHQQAMGAFFGKLSQAKTDEERRELGRTFPQPAPYIARMMKVVDARPKSVEAVEAMQWVLQYDRSGTEVEGIISRLADEFADTELIQPVAAFLLEYQPSPQAGRLLDALIAKSPVRATRGAALLVKGKRSMQQEDTKPGEKLLEQVVAEYGDVEVFDRRLGTMAAAELFELRHLAVGKIAPEIAGKDVDGVKFQLSDYRGKVVVIDFWGDW